MKGINDKSLVFHSYSAVLQVTVIGSSELVSEPCIHCFQDYTNMLHRKITTIFSYLALIMLVKQLI